MHTMHTPPLPNGSPKQVGRKAKVTGEEWTTITLKAQIKAIVSDGYLGISPSRIRLHLFLASGMGFNDRQPGRDRRVQRRFSWRSDSEGTAFAGLMLPHCRPREASRIIRILKFIDLDPAALISSRPGKYHSGGQSTVELKIHHCRRTRITSGI